MLAEHTCSSLAAKEARQLTPVSDYYPVKERLAETTEAVSVLARKGSPPIGDYGDIASPTASA
ncbi:MAG: hypothetical protein LBN36_02570, partial [Clostridiales Family XIII bacterium]|nr:hypothetical protein [Clostridiales Family XIII bacterium]